MPALEDLLAFNVEQAAVSLWIARGPTGPSGTPPNYTARWVELSDDLVAVLKETVTIERDRIEDVQDYDLLAAVLEGGALTISADETHAALLTGRTIAQTPERRVRGLQDMRNASFYAIKLVQGDDVIYAVRKTDAVWKTKNAINLRTMIFQENELTLDNRPRFDLATNVDFFIVGEDLLVIHKGHFESILRYKQAHKDDFAALQAEPEFAAVFVNLAPLINHVGENKIQLRRASAIRQKGHYRDQAFMQRLRQHHAALGLVIQFDGAGRIVATPDTCAQIMTALLDHRLSSVFSAQIYDVPSAVVVAVGGGG